MGPTVEYYKQLILNAHVVQNDVIFAEFPKRRKQQIRTFLLGVATVDPLALTCARVYFNRIFMNLLFKCVGISQHWWK